MIIEDVQRDEWLISMFQQEAMTRIMYISINVYDICRCVLRTDEKTDMDEPEPADKREYTKTFYNFIMQDRL